MADRLDKYPLQEKLQNPGLVQTEIQKTNPNFDRIRMKFRNTVGMVMEEIPDDEIRIGLSQTFDEVYATLNSLDLYKFLPLSQINVIEDELIKSRIQSFFATIALNEERKQRKALREEVDELREENQVNKTKLQKEMDDELTGLLRKKYLKSGFKHTLQLLSRESYDSPVPVSLIFFDLDHFKNVNDTYGHEAGDIVLRAIGSKVREIFQRDSDILGKYGGEEFVVILPHCNETNARILAEKLRQEIEDMEIEVSTNGTSQTIKVTISAGVLTAILHKISKGQIENTMGTMLEEADQLLYKGKRTGRNRFYSKEMNIGDMPSDDGALV